MINWPKFKVKYNNREQWAFEQMSYFLFSSEMGSHIGAFRYKNQPGIETEPIAKDGKLFGFQAKYYEVSISKNKGDIIDSIKKSKNQDLSPDILLLYVNNELSKNSKNEKPRYQTEIEQAARDINIEIEWRVPSNIELQLSHPSNRWIREIFFGDNGLDPCFFNNQIEKEILNLGPRFNEELNFELPIARLFDNVSHNEYFYRRLVEVIDNWLTEKSYRKQKDNVHISDIEKELAAIRKELINWVREFEYSFDNPILLSDSLSKISKITSKSKARINELYIKEDSKKSSNKFDNERGRLREIINNNNEFLGEIETLKINIVNNPILIIQGEAGCGKSHLLGDIAEQRSKRSLPTILLLGTTFSESNTIEKNILNKLDLTCDFKGFLIDLNNIGLRLNTRVLIFIDAINEGAGADLWNSQISGFINDIMKYPAIGLVLTIRSTYFEDIIPDSFTTNNKINLVTHTGFKGNEYEALRLFCKYYNLKQPDFPLLNPEFSNPLFLQLTCEALKDSPQRSFPKGFNGVDKIYSTYKEILNRRFGKKRHEYKNRSIVSKAIQKFANALLTTKYNQLEIDTAVSLFDEEFPTLPHLLSDLIEECVIIKTSDEHSETHKDLVFFSYQKFGDFFIAEELLQPFSNKEKIEEAFRSNPIFKRIANEHQWLYRGIVEAFSILLPEKYNLELFELINFFFPKDTDLESRVWLKNHTYATFTGIVIDSLKWRDINSIDDCKITQWLEENGRITSEEWFYSLTELSVIAGHPFNSDRLFKILNRYSMPERDSFWQKYLVDYCDRNDDNNPFPLRRLMEWAWMPDISFVTDNETARLVAQTLIWVLATTNISLRDQTTKALVNLLEQKPAVLIYILKKFKNINDLYIKERLFAVAYGCILRTKNDNAIKKIAQYIYSTIFKDKNPPAHILLRDYARNAIEYAVFKGVGVDINLKLIRPPYNSSMPVLPQDENAVKKYQLDYDSRDFKSNYGSEQNAIYGSLISGISDFGNKTVEPAIRNFSSFSFRDDEKYRRFIRRLNTTQREVIKLYFECKRQQHNLATNQNYSNTEHSALQQKFLKSLRKNIDYCKKEIKNIFDPNEIGSIKEFILPYFDRKIETGEFNPWYVRFWIVKRVFELGYDRELHGEYDSSARSYHWQSGYNNKVERIGKKYQWIAFHEILANLADNYKIKSGWSSESQYKYYKGSWQFYVRDIDPAYIKKNTHKETNKVVHKSKDWWEDEDYNQWDYPDSKWVESIEDLIPPENIIEKQDLQGNKWLHLQHYVNWEEPKKLGAEKYEGRRKEIMYLIQGYLVKKKDRNKIINYLKHCNLWGRWLPENNNDYSNLYNREKFWSPAYINTYGKSRNIWETIRNTNYRVIVTIESANGGIERDKSGANRAYRIPCKYIFEGMNLQYSPIDGNLNNIDGDIIVMNSNPTGVLIRQNELLQFLDDRGLDIIWAILGEKYSFCQDINEKSYFKVPCGVYYLEEGQVKGELKMFDRE